MATDFDPTKVDLTTVDPVDVICYFGLGDNEYDGRLGVHISAIFVIFIISTAVTFLPVVAVRMPKLRIPIYVYLFARYFGAGVILATAFIHLMDPAYAEIGPNTCVGMTGGWSSYSFVAGIILSSVTVVFLLDFIAERYVEVKYGISAHENIEPLVTNVGDHANHQNLHSGDQDEAPQPNPDNKTVSDKEASLEDGIEQYYHSTLDDHMAERQFRQQIAAFLILEFGVIFHSVIIGLNLGTSGSEFDTLYIVLVFHQSFEGLGIGARLSSIPMPRKLHWLPWALCASYGLTTPISIAIGLGLRTQYNAGSFIANVVSGVLDAISAGILIYTALVELLARDFLFNPNRTKSSKRLAFMVGSTVLGAGIMALLGKWA